MHRFLARDLIAAIAASHQDQLERESELDTALTWLADNLDGEWAFRCRGWRSREITRAMILRAVIEIDEEADAALVMLKWAVKPLGQS